MDELNSITRKLRSEKGASITFGLMVFLVCAVLSTIIIVASMTAAGRVSKLTETDQRYYTVTSAAQMLEKALGEDTISLVKEEQKTRTTKYNDNGEEDGEPVDSDGVTKVYLVPSRVNNPNALNDAGTDYAYRRFPVIYDSSNTMDPKKGISYADFENDKEKLTAYIVNQYAALTEDDPEGSFSLALTTTGIVPDAKLDGKIDQSGDLTITVSSGGYSLDMSFAIDKKESHDNRTVQEEDPGSNRDNNKVVEQVSDYTITSINWKLTEIETLK